MRMPVAMRDKWVAALRSGKYQQDYGCLRTANGHCCLGVLQETVMGDVEKVGPDNKESAGSPTVKWYEEHGVQVKTSEYGKYKFVDDHHHHKLMTMNDGEEFSDDLGTRYPGDKSFAEIADWIEENVEVY